MRFIIKLLINIVSLALIVPFALAFWEEVTGFELGLKRNMMFLGGTVVSGIICYLFSRRLEFFSTFEHELTHNVWAMLFFKKPREQSLLQKR